MPLYEYQCEACGHRFEVIQKFADAPIETCPKCGGRVHKLQSAPAFQFKGSGWYITDYARKDQGGGGKEDAAKGDAAKSDTAKTDAGSQAGGTDSSAGSKETAGSEKSGASAGATSPPPSSENKTAKKRSTKTKG